ncbi:MAG TPA: PHB depolymerase family esterase [Planctomycetaceae bacterium]|nr:PHB depolymerase family esterase [Planctomycetaceae bacterium]
MTRIHGRFVALSLLVVCAASRPCLGQIGPADVVFARLSSSTVRMAYVDRGGDMSAIEPLLADAGRNALTNPLESYREFTHAMTLMNGGKWTPEAELATGLDFATSAKVVAAGEPLQCRATFLFDAPSAEAGPYRLQLDLLKPDKLSGEGQKAEPSKSNASESRSVEPGIVLGDVRGRKEGETVGLILDPSKRVGPGLHLLRATLKNGKDETLYEYYRTFFVVDNLNRRLAAAQKTIDLLNDQTSRAATSARYLLDTIRLAQLSYLGGAFQNLTGYLHTAYRARGFALAEAMDFDAALETATKLATALKEGHDPFAGTTGDLRLAYRSGFDGKLVPYRVYVPSKYDKSKKYPLITLLHGAGGDENNFFDRYEGRWPKLAQERGFIIVAVNGRGPLSGYQKANGAERDVLDVTDLVEKNYNIDPNRVYLAGHSMGAAGTWLIGLTHRDRFAALAPIAGSRMSGLLESALKSGPKIPLMIVAGAKDALVPVAGCRAAAKKAKELGYDVKYLEYPDGDHISVAISSVKDIFDFFEAHKKAQGPESRAVGDSTQRR